jgi:hypothetical protein
MGKLMQGLLLISFVYLVLSVTTNIRRDQPSQKSAASLEHICVPDELKDIASEQCKQQTKDVDAFSRISAYYECYRHILLQNHEQGSC